MAKTTVNYRSAVTGKYVKESYAKSHPNTTVRETNKSK
ncbi:MAG: multidrug transporter [Candidatus Absconditicoccaceae bacterium]